MPWPERGEQRPCGRIAATKACQLYGRQNDAERYRWGIVLEDDHRPRTMPSWQDKLSETQRWELVNYLRKLAQEGKYKFLGNAS